MKSVKLAVVAGSLLLAAPALAQDADPSEGGMEMEGEASMEAGTTGMEGSADASAGEPGAALGWPSSVIDRPYLRGKGSISAGLDFSLLRVAFSIPDLGISDSVTVDVLTLSGTYGITDKISAGALYSISLGLGDGDFEAAGPLTLWGGYQVLHDGKLSVAATAAFGIDLDNTDDMFLSAGLGARYLLSPKMALFTGGATGPITPGGLGGPGPVGNHLNISLADGGPITFDIPLGFGFQATPQLYAFATTNLLTLGISNSDSSFIFADYIPLGIGGVFSVNKNIDVVATFDLLDLKDVGFDVFTFSVGARWYN